MNEWKLVPVTPTEEMKKAGKGYLGMNTDMPAEVWSDMLSAAPEVEPLGVRHQCEDTGKWYDCIDNDPEFYREHGRKTRSLFVFIQPEQESGK